MKRPFAQEMTLLKSDSLGHGVSRCQTEATELNWLWAKACRSSLASRSVARSYDKYDGSVRVLKKHWISTSVLLVMTIFSHEASAAALPRTFRRRGRLLASPHSSIVSMTKMRVCSGWRGRVWMKLRKKEPFNDSRVSFGSSQRCFATMVRKGGKCVASSWIKVGMFIGSLRFGLFLPQEKAAARWVRL